MFPGPKRWEKKASESRLLPPAQKQAFPGVGCVSRMGRRGVWARDRGEPLFSSLSRETSPGSL